MHRINGEDSAFLSLDLPSQPFTSHFMALLRLPEGPDGRPHPVSLEALARHIEIRLGELPAFRWRILAVPHGLYHEVAIEDPDFDITQHLHEVTAPAPGGPEAFARIADDYAARRLDRSRPLWEIILVNGLADGRQGLIVRFHHALMDGAPTLQLFDRLLSGDDHVPVRPATDWVPDAIPSDRELTRQAWPELRATWRKLPALIRSTYRGARAQRQLQVETGFVPPKTPKDTPACSLNDAFTARRGHANLELPMGELNRIRRTAGVTFTNVVLAVVAGGLRSHLEAIDDLPELPLITGVPMAFSKPGPAREAGNRFINFNVRLATDVVDPWERLLRIDAEATGSRRSMEAFNGELFCDWTEQLPPFVTRGLIAGKVHDRMRDRTTTDINVNISVLRGPDRPWRLGPAEVEEFYMEGPPNSGCGVSVTAMSYGDRLSVGVSTCADAVPDPADLGRRIEDSLDELLSAADQIAADRATTTTTTTTTTQGPTQPTAV